MHVSSKPIACMNVKPNDNDKKVEPDDPMHANGILLSIQQ